MEGETKKDQLNFRKPRVLLEAKTTYLKKMNAMEINTLALMLFFKEVPHLRIG